MSIFPVLAAGEVVRNDFELGEAHPGVWVVWRVWSTVTICRLGLNEDGELCTTLPRVTLDWNDAALLVPLRYNLFLQAETVPLLPQMMLCESAVCNLSRLRKLPRS